MPQPRKRAGAKAAPVLPPISNAKFREALRALEDVVERNTETYIEHGKAFADRKREATKRPFSAVEIGAIARGLDTTMADAQQQLADANLPAYDDPIDQEILIAAGVATTPELFDAVIRLTVLIEMPKADFNAACAEDRLQAALDDAVTELDDLGLIEQRQRASAAWGHLSVAMGYDPGKAWGLIGKTIWQTISQGMAALRPGQPTTSSAPSIESPADTTGPGASSSTS